MLVGACLEMAAGSFMLDGSRDERHDTHKGADYVWAREPNQRDSNDKPQLNSAAVWFVCSLQHCPILVREEAPVCNTTVQPRVFLWLPQLQQSDTSFLVKQSS